MHNNEPTLKHFKSGCWNFLAEVEIGGVAGGAVAGHDEAAAERLDGGDAEGARHWRQGVANQPTREAKQQQPSA